MAQANADFEYRRLNLFIDHLAEVSFLINNKVDFRRDIKKIVNHVASYINAQKGAIIILEAEGMIFYSFGFEKTEKKKIKLILEGMKSYQKIQFDELFPGSLSILSKKISNNSNTFGEIFFINKESRSGFVEFTDMDDRFISILADQIGVAFEKLALFNLQKGNLEFFRTVLDSVSNAIVVTDKDYTILMTNDYFRRLFEDRINNSDKLTELLPLNSPLRRFIESTSITLEMSRLDNVPISAVSGKTVNATCSPISFKQREEIINGHLFTFEDISEVKHLKDNFSKYVNREVADFIIHNKQRQRLGGERLEAAIFFSDIRGFTSMSEKLSPEDVVETLNQYYNLMLGCVSFYGGDIDKLVGDEIMAIYKPSKKFPNARECAVKTAQLMKERLTLFNEMHSEIGGVELNFGVGINYGEVVMGNIGSFQRMDYTIIGDNVNIAARLCSAAAKNQILVTKSVIDHLNGEFTIRELAPLKVKGKDDPLAVYEII